MIHDLDDLLFIKGREFIKKVYQQKLQEHIERTASEMAAKLPDCLDIRNNFQKAKGEKEFQLDGAKWLWNVVRDVFGKTDECLDIYHASEHLASCGKILYGNGQTFMDWLDRMRFVLLS
jgi:hypothetical protein